MRVILRHLRFGYACQPFADSCGQRCVCALRMVLTLGMGATALGHTQQARAAVSRRVGLADMHPAACGWVCTSCAWLGRCTVACGWACACAGAPGSAACICLQQHRLAVQPIQPQ